MVNFDDLPLDFDITAGVIVLIFMLRANFLNIGIKPSMFVLWFDTNLPNFFISILD